MTKKTKKRKNPKTQADRLKNAAIWVNRYTGRNLIKKYNRRYSISLVDCVKELAMLGLPITMDDLRKYKKAQAQRREQKKAHKLRQAEEAAIKECQLHEEFWFDNVEMVLESPKPNKRRLVRSIDMLGFIRLMHFPKEIYLDEGDVPF